MKKKKGEQKQKYGVPYYWALAKREKVSCTINKVDGNLIGNLLVCSGNALKLVMFNV